MRLWALLVMTMTMKAAVTPFNALPIGRMAQGSRSNYKQAQRHRHLVHSEPGYCHRNRPQDKTTMATGAVSNPTTLKLLIIGDSGTGKSSILLRFVDDKFLGEETQTATIGMCGMIPS